MRRHKNSKFMGIILLVLVLGIGYAYLNTTLIINGTTHVHSSTWDIYWDNIQVKDGSVSAETPEIDTNKTTVSFEVDLDKPGDFFEFTVDAKNDGNIDAMVDTILNKLNNTEISTTNPLPSYITYTVTYEDGVAIEEKQLLRASTKDTYKVRVEYKKNIQEEDLPENNQSLQFSFSVTYVQATNEAVQRVYANVIQATYSGDLTAFRATTYRSKIKIINLDDEINPPDNIIESWDIGEAQNGDVMAYITTNQDDNTMYDLYIQGDGHLYANEDSSYLFYPIVHVDQINGIDNLDVSRTTNMSHMFDSTGYSSTVFNLDLGNNFDTSQVTNMTNMFYQTGYNDTVFTLDLGDKFDTSNVTDMSHMFDGTGYKSTVFTLDLGDKFDTSQVTNMTNMFYQTGYNDTVFTLDLGNKFDTSNVTDMSHMFNSTGCHSTVFTLDLGDKFDTSQVTNMTNMFYQTGLASTVFTLDLENKFDTSNVTNMSDMFRYLGHYSTIFTLNLGNKFDTSKVTNMSYMFFETGYINPSFNLNLGNKFDTSQVTNMRSMFNSTGFNSTVFTLDLGDKFDTSKVTNMSSMFSQLAKKSTVFTLDLGDKFDTSNVTEMEYMFYYTGYSSPVFTLDLGDYFDTSKVTTMKSMFSYTGWSNNNFELDLSTCDFSKVKNSISMFYGWGSSKKVYVKDASDQSWVISHGDSSALTTSNVLIKSN